MSAAFWRKYATVTHIYIPIIKRGVVDFAVSADWTPAAGDVRVSIDGAASGNIATLPTAITMGNTAMWDFSLSTGETTGKKISVTVADAATKAVEDQMFLIETYGNASAEYPPDFSLANLPANMVQVAGAAVSTTTAQIGTNVVSTSTDAITASSIAADAITSAELSTTAVNEIRDAILSDSTPFQGARIDATISSRLAPTVAARTLDVTATGEAGIDWANIGAPTTTQNLSGTSIASVNGAVGSVTGAVGSVTGNVGGNVVGSVGSVTGAVGSVTGAVGSVSGNVGGNVTGSVGSLAAQAKTDVNAEVLDVLTVDTYTEPGQNAPGVNISLKDKIGYLYKFMRNKITQTSTTLSVYADDTTTVDHKSTVTDDGTTYTRGEISAGP